MPKKVYPELLKATNLRIISLKLIRMAVEPKPLLKLRRAIAQAVRREHFNISFRTSRRILLTNLFTSLIIFRRTA
jgi:hypothetical protein